MAGMGIRIGTEEFAKLHQEGGLVKAENLVRKAYFIMVEAGVDPYDAVFCIGQSAALHNAFAQAGAPRKPRRMPKPSRVASKVSRSGSGGRGSRGKTSKG